MNYKSLITSIGIENLNNTVKLTALESNHTPYRNSRAYAAGVECGMAALLKCIEQAGYTINKRKKFTHNVKKTFYTRRPISKSVRMRYNRI